MVFSELIHSKNYTTTHSSCISTSSISRQDSTIPTEHVLLRVLAVHSNRDFHNAAESNLPHRHNKIDIHNDKSCDYILGSSK